ncbi:MAG: lysine transporter LysE [Betaproteobacteria bacterium]|nr:MAG: lysine transporter LysE [Betaproteobacteria bacterium]
MIPLDTLLLFAGACVALAMTPGPNHVYLVSRTLAQGRAAGLVSLAGTASGLALHIAAAALGLSAVLAAVPAAYDAVRWAGAAYLLYVAWQTWRAPPPAGAGRARARLPVAALYRDGVLTGTLNPKVALFQLAFFPQFVDPAHGSVLAQSALLGVTQLAVVASYDALLIAAAGSVRGWFGARPGWTAWSRRLLAGVFALLALRLVAEARR